MKLRNLISLIMALWLLAGGAVFAADWSAKFYEDDDFGGGSHEVTGEKKGNLPNFLDDDLCSVKVAPCYKLELWDGHNYDTGNQYAVLFEGEHRSLQKREYAYICNEASSYRITKAFDVSEITKTTGNPGDTFIVKGYGFEYEGEVLELENDWGSTTLEDPYVELVRIGGKEASFNFISDTELEVTVGTQSGKVTVLSNYGCEATSSETFEVCPEIASLSKTTGLPGDTLTINGDGWFKDVTIQDVKIGDESVTRWSVESAYKITAVVGEKSGKVTVVTDACDVISDDSFTVPGPGYTYYDITGAEIDNSDANLIENNAVMRYNEREGRTEYRLEIGHDFSESDVGTGYFENFGNPLPEVGKYWHNHGKVVDLSVNGAVNEAGRQTRHIATGYYLYEEVSGDFARTPETFSGDETEDRAFTIRMDGPIKVYFRWKTQHQVQASTIPAEMGDMISLEGSEDHDGAGTWWYDAGETLVASAREDCLKLIGYLDNVTNFTDPVPADSTTILIDRPYQITWRYEAHNYDARVTVGDTIDLFSSEIGIPQAVLDRTDAEAEPIEAGDVGAESSEELFYWSPADKKLYPLIGGRTFQVEWQSKSGSACEQKLITTITTRWPSTPHYVHVAETPPVPLDPYGNDQWAFKALKYAEADADVSRDLTFTAAQPGRSTLLFTRAAGGTTAVGDENLEGAHVRVVETRMWSEDKTDADAIIGEEITSGHHDARVPHNGYILWENARYNADVYDRAEMHGAIFAVNRQFTSTQTDDLLVIWYEVKDNISWPRQPVLYACDWPADPKRIVIAGREGGEGRGADGAYQTWPDAGGNQQNYLDPARYKDVAIYQQPDPALPGYNPNEEHALAATSFRHRAMAAQPRTAFALRYDLNVASEDADYTSEPYVLLQYYDIVEARHGMDVFRIDLVDPQYGYVFEYPMKAGDPVTAPYPLNEVIGAAPPTEISGRNGDPGRNCYWEDHKGQPWAVSGDAHLFSYFWYPLQPEFWYEKDHNGNDAVEEPGDPVPWLPSGVVSETDDRFPADMVGKPKAIEVRYDTVWPEETPVLKAGETVTFAGGEYRADNPQTPKGLPMALGWAAGQVIFDDLNPAMDAAKMFDSSLARLAQVLEERSVDFPVGDMPEDLTPASGKVKTEGGRWYFEQLHSGLKTRVFYDPITNRLGIRGFVNDKTLGDSDLTASPPSVYVLQPNILTETERDTLKSLEGADANFKAKVEELYALTRNPSGFENQDYTVGISDAVEELASFKETLFASEFAGLCGSLHSLCPSCGFDEICEGSGASDEKPYPNMALGPGLALMASPELMDPASTVADGYITVAENNHPALGSLPVALHIVKVVNDKYRGAVKTIYADNVFDEKITLRHTADFGANPEDVVFQWRYREVDGTEQPPPDTAPAGTWKAFPGDGPEVAMTGAGSALLTDNWFFCRYRHKDGDADDPAAWSNWAGAANSRPPKAGEDPAETFQAMLAEGWVKRVINGINPFEARINDFYSSDSPATYTSMVQQAGQRFEGAVAFNPEKDVVENLGLIELYQTVLMRAADLSINLEQPEGSSGVYAACFWPPAGFRAFTPCWATRPTPTPWTPPSGSARTAWNTAAWPRPSSPS